MLDLILITIGVILIIVGIIGCVVPVLPGPVISYGGLIFLQLSSKNPFSVHFLVIFALLTLLVSILDNVIPIYGTKKLQGSRYGIWGSAIGLVIGILFLFPFGIIVGPVIGAFAGELISGKPGSKAIQSAAGSFLGFLAGTAIKLILSASMTYYFFTKVYFLYFS